MNEIELLRAYRQRAAQPDPQQERTAREELLELIEQERERDARPYRPALGRVPRRGLAIAVAVCVLPAAYAIADGLSESSIPTSVPALACPEIPRDDEQGLRAARCREDAAASPSASPGTARQADELPRPTALDPERARLRNR
jgi:hypothetical protein